MRNDLCPITLIGGYLGAGKTTLINRMLADPELPQDTAVLVNDFGDINSQSYYGTLSKHLFEVGGVNVSGYGGATFIEKLGEVRAVGGVHLRKGAWSSMLMYSGVDEHVSITRIFGNHSLTFLMFDLKLPGLAYGFNY